jgi:hypothetical protein
MIVHRQTRRIHRRLDIEHGIQFALSPNESLPDELNGLDTNEKDKVEAFRFIADRMEHPLVFDYDLEVDSNEDEAMDPVQSEVESMIRYDTISIASDLTESDAEFEGDSNDADLLDEEEMMNDAEIEGIEGEVDEGEGATFTTPLPNSMSTSY